MKRQAFLKTILAMFAVVLLSNVAASAQKKSDCAATTDAEIVKAVYAKLAVKYDIQLIHINVRSKDGVLTVEGWATTKKVRSDIEKIIKKVSCVKSLTNKLTVGIGGGCGPGQKKCGAICIDQADECNICTAKTCN